MEKKIITFSANEQQLIKTGGIDCYASNIVAYIEAQFDLGANWQGFDSVRAVWYTGYVKGISTVLDSNGKCIVPYEVLTHKGDVMVNLVGSISDGETLTDRLTTCPVTAVAIKCNAIVDGDNAKPITPSEYEQFVATVKADADRAEAGATASANSAQSASESATASANSATSSAQSAIASARSAQNASESAISAESAKDDAEDARDKILGMRATAETLEAGSDATASYDNGLLTLGIPRGDKGDKGDKGDTGATPNFSIGEVDTLKPNESATATITGTAENPVLNLGIPKGERGDVNLSQLEALLPTETASGEIVTITDGQSVVPVKSLKVTLEPIQDLNGYDKPWAGGAGKNLFDSSAFPETGSQAVLYTHYEVQNGTYTMSTPDFPLVGGITNVYFLAGAVSSGASSGSNGVSQSTPITITVTDGYYTVAYRSTNDINTNNPINFKWQIEVGNSATTFAPYSNICPISGRDSVETIVSSTTSASDGTTYTSPLGRTVYGGTLDVVSGELVVDRAMVDLGTLSWTYSNRCMVSDAISPSGSVGAVGSSNNVVCSSYKARPTRNYTTSYDNGMCGLTVGGTQIIVRDDNYTDPSSFKASASGVQFVYELATPQTIQLTSQEVELLTGTNNVWSDGNVTLVYSADIQRYIEKKLGTRTALTMSRPIVDSLKSADTVESADTNSVESVDTEQVGDDL